MSWTPERLKALRKHVGMTQAQMGEYLGYSKHGAQVRISELERGQKRVSGAVSRLLDMLAQQHDFKE